jgi:hypothetical protein
MHTIRSYVFTGSRVTIHETDKGWVALAIGNDGLPMHSKPITAQEAHLAIGLNNHTVIEQDR